MPQTDYPEINFMTTVIAAVRSASQMRKYDLEDAERG